MRAHDDSLPDRSPDRWITRAEQADDAAEIRAVLRAAFPTELEADLVEALREDPVAWLDGLSMVTLEDDRVIAQALLTRAFIAGEPVLALAPCATHPDHQRRGAGSAAIRAALAQARAQGENLVVVLGHPGYYPRFGFVPASSFGITAPFEVPDDAFLALALDPEGPAPRGEIVYPSAFGV
ncbi:GNAT family N-acetyltransferase [uncultured Brachybacterium sp.]|uniref:GNAT family N-acetyltransferase n=1 Tax=uncultured Brachybacterium sp. TaxID=189680 RepID=UPI00261CCD5E|nr:N-acetyltransferase [uncultured Brachybacterium sp.]